MWVICDLDGTLCDHDARHHLARTDREMYHAKCYNDPPVPGVLFILQLVLKAGHNVAFITGRPEMYRSVTNKWITDHMVLALGLGELHMRPDGDTRPDAELKSYIYNENFARRDRKVIFVLDDRKRVVEMWRGKGLLCLSPAEGDY